MMAAVSAVGSTANAYIDGVLSGTKWASLNFTYSFPADASYYGAGYGSGEPTNGFQAFNSAQQGAVRTVLSMVASVTNVTFSQITETMTTHADLRFAESNLPSTAWAYFPATQAAGGDAWFNSASGTYDAPRKGNYAFLTFAHEIGHALGLKHAHEVEGSFKAMPADRDSMEYTMMSYRSYEGASTTGGYTNESWGYAQSLMMYDVAALQHMYGANYSTYSGATTYTWSATTGEMFINGVGTGAPGANRTFLTVWDGGGTDTYDFSSYASGLRVNLEPGAWSRTSTGQLAKLHYNGSQVADGIANALLVNGDLRSLIENAIGGSGDDVILGNLAANRLSGGSGGDELTGGAGNDWLDGGAGSDIVVLSGSQSQYGVMQLQDGSYQFVDLRAGSPDGTDLLFNIELIRFLDATAVIADLLQVTTRVAGLRSVGSSANDTLMGSGGADVLSGLDGDDELVGEGANDALFGDAGNDLVKGGAGEDELRGFLGGDTLFGETGDDRLYGEEDNDFIGAGDGHDLAFGGAGDDQLYGETGDDVLFGDAGKDLINGGSGRDQLRGYFGDDTLFGEDGDDQLYGEQDRDFIGAGAGHDLAFGGDDDDQLYGEAGNDILYGDAGKDLLNGGDGDDELRGFLGNDTLFGGLGNDCIYGEQDNDFIGAGAGNDQVFGGAGDDIIFGEVGNDELFGESGNDTFAFRGNFGRDLIRDFQGGSGAGDVIEFSTDLFGSFNAVQSAITQVGADTVIVMDALNTIRLASLTISQLTPDDFRFV